MPHTHDRRVFIVQRPTRLDPATGAYVPTHDLSPAAGWGSVVVCLPDNASPFRDLAHTAALIDAVFAEHRANAEDWLLLVGNPALIGVVATLFARRTGTLPMLQWNTADRDYRPLMLQLSDVAPAASPA